MKNILLYMTLAIVSLMAFTSCEEADSEKDWGIPVIYMPQANYDPYVVPNRGTAEQTNLNYRINEETWTLDIFLGVYRSGLQELKEYSVEVTSENAKVDGATELSAAYYTLPEKVVCPAGKRDVTFYLSVDLDYLISNSRNNYSVGVYIFNPDGYELNPDLTFTTVLINTSELLEKEQLL